MNAPYFLIYLLNNRLLKTMHALLQAFSPSVSRSHAHSQSTMHPYVLHDPPSLHNILNLNSMPSTVHEITSHACTFAPAHTWFHASIPICQLHPISKSERGSPSSFHVYTQRDMFQPFNPYTNNTAHGNLHLAPFLDNLQFTIFFPG